VGPRRKKTFHFHFLKKLLLPIFLESTKGGVDLKAADEILSRIIYVVSRQSRKKNFKKFHGGELAEES
jgi:hypothetical protein